MYTIRGYNRLIDLNERSLYMASKSKPVDPKEYDGNFIREVAPIYRGKRKDRRVELKCTVCHSLFVVGYYNSRRTRQKTCSNQCGGIITRQNRLYRAETHPLYSVWLSMRDRCNNPNNPRYSRYGGRGIKVSDDFEYFESFVDYLQKLPNYPYDKKGERIKNTSLDRINTDGNYSIGNLRWASPFIQAANKSWKKPDSSSKAVGVHYCNTNNAWVSRVQHQGKLYHVYYGPSESEAIEARKAFILKNSLPNTY